MLFRSETGYSVRQVIRAIKQLVDLGEFEVFTANTLNAKSKMPNNYFMTIECPESCDGSPAHRPVTVWSQIQPRKVIHMGDKIDTYG